MARLRVPLEALAPGERVLDEETARYVGRVHRLGRGAAFRAFDPAQGLEAECEVLTTGARVVIRIGEPSASVHVARRRVTVVQAIGKGSKLEDVLRDATELGATRFVVALGLRSVKRPEPTQGARWRKVAVEAARQCGRGDIPEVAGPMPLEAALGEAGARRWLLDPMGIPVAEQLRGEARWSARPDSSESTVLVVGPEGGFDPREIEAAERLGFVRVRIGTFVLRTETACAAALGALAALDDRCPPPSGEEPDAACDTEPHAGGPRDRST